MFLSFERFEMPCHYMLMIVNGKGVRLEEEAERPSLGRKHRLGGNEPNPFLIQKKKYMTSTTRQSKGAMPQRLGV